MFVTGVPAGLRTTQVTTADTAALTKLVRDMDVKELRSNYILYIAAGAVATGGIISMVQALPLIFSSVLSGLSDLRAKGDQARQAVPRTEREWLSCTKLPGMPASA